MLSNGTVEPQQISHPFARVHWFVKHPCQEVLPYPLKVFATLTKNGGSSTFLPLSRIMSRCAVCNTTVMFDFGTNHVLLFCPTNKKIHLYKYSNALALSYVIYVHVCVCHVNICFLSHDM